MPNDHAISDQDPQALANTSTTTFHPETTSAPAPPPALHLCPAPARLEAAVTEQQPFNLLGLPLELRRLVLKFFLLEPPALFLDDPSDSRSPGGATQASRSVVRPHLTIYGPIPGPLVLNPAAPSNSTHLPFPPHPFPPLPPAANPVSVNQQNIWTPLWPHAPQPTALQAIGPVVPSAIPPTTPHPPFASQLIAPTIAYQLITPQTMPFANPGGLRLSTGHLASWVPQLATVPNFSDVYARNVSRLSIALPFCRYSRQHEQGWRFTSGLKTATDRADPNTLAILRVNSQLYTEARQVILENKIMYLDINEITRNLKSKDALVGFLHRVFQTRHLHFTVVLIPPSLCTIKGKYDYNCLQLVLETFSEDREKHHKVKSQMHVEMTIACERNKEATAIWRTAHLAFKYNKRPGIDFSIRIAASKICQYAAHMVAELRHHRKTLSNAVAGFEAQSIRACVVDITKEPWF